MRHGALCAPCFIPGLTRAFAMRIVLGLTRTLRFLLCSLALGMPYPTTAQLTWGLEPVLTIGTYDGDVTFASIGGIAVRPSGEILVLDRGGLDHGLRCGRLEAR